MNGTREVEKEESSDLEDMAVSSAEEGNWAQAEVLLSFYGGLLLCGWEIYDLPSKSSFSGTCFFLYLHSSFLLFFLGVCSSKDSFACLCGLSMTLLP